MRRQKNVRVALGCVDNVDRRVRTLTLEGGARLDLDYLEFATGARHAYFGYPEWTRAEPSDAPAERAARMTSGVIGAARPESRWPARWPS